MSATGPSPIEKPTEHTILFQKKAKGLSGSGRRERQEHCVQVALGPRSYTIRIGRGLLAEAAQQVRSAAPNLSRAMLITDQNVEPLYAAPLQEQFQSAGIPASLLVVEPGEASKSIGVASLLWEDLLEQGADRKTVVVAVGGGVVGDLAGFVAAAYARGIRLYQIPTSLLAQVDSSVGGKVGVDLPKAKNMVGAFWQPVGVLIDPATLHTLPEREYISGLAEVVKYGVILDADFFDRLEQHVEAIRRRDEDVLAWVIARCCRLKADVVEQDEREETGLRAILNYGHTFAHAFETLTGYSQLLHGEAVAMGMQCAARLAVRLGRLEAELASRQQKLLEALGLPVDPPSVDPEQVLEVMRHDKKASRGRLRFILPHRIGHVELVEDVPADQVLTVL